MPPLPHQQQTRTPPATIVGADPPCQIHASPKVTITSAVTIITFVQVVPACPFSTVIFVDTSLASNEVALITESVPLSSYPARDPRELAVATLVERSYTQTLIYLHPQAMFLIVTAPVTVNL